MVIVKLQTFRPKETHELIEVNISNECNIYKLM